MVSAAGCARSFDAFCEESIDCSDGNTEDKDACIVSNEAEQDRASLFGCSEWFNIVADCIEQEAECENNQYSAPANECQDELRDYNNCMSR